MDEIKTTGFPPTFLNRYINAQLANFGIMSQASALLPAPFIPAQYPTNIEDVYNDFVQLYSQVGEGNAPTLIVYDRLMRFRPTPFYRNKREQLIYFIYSTDVENLLGAIRVITDALDREDAAAQDVNKWLNDNPINGIPNNIFFHNIKVYQADESRDVAELASARTLFVNKIIVEYDYHITDEIVINGTTYKNPYN